MKKTGLCFIFLLGFISTAVFATPSEIVIIRHADKWSGGSGQFLSPKGQLRAEKFVSYYLSHFPKPDFIFASSPQSPAADDVSISVRPLQTVAPLANQLTYLNKKDFFVYFPYTKNQYPQLAQDLLHSKKYNQKLILICWQHGKINLLARDLGVTHILPTWEENAYDTVYVLKYDADGKLDSFLTLKNQYPVIQNPSWKALAN